MLRVACHSERSEESLVGQTQILRCAQNDNSHLADPFFKNLPLKLPETALGSALVFCEQSSYNMSGNLIMN